MSKKIASGKKTTTRGRNVAKPKSAKVTHPYWGVVEQDWAGFSATRTLALPPFGKTGIEIFLGAETDEDGEDIEAPPSTTELNQMAAACKALSKQLDAIVLQIQAKAFARYRKLYAHYYEDAQNSKTWRDLVTPAERGAALKIDSAAKHFEYMRDINYVRITAPDTIRIPIHYKLDTEHGLEIKIVKGKVKTVGGIAET
jgi:hypothetical protein